MDSKEALVQALNSAVVSVDSDNDVPVFMLCTQEMALALYEDDKEGVYSAYTGIYSGDGGATVQVRSWQDSAELAHISPELRGQVDACIRAYLPSFFN